MPSKSHHDDGTGPGIVYLIERNDGLFKIGYSRNFKQRFSGIKYENRGFELRLVHVMFAESRIEVERFWHSYFADKREWREWFRLTAEDIDIFCECWGTRPSDIQRTIQQIKGVEAA